MVEGLPYYEKMFKFDTYKKLKFSKRDISFLPKYIINNLEKFKNYILGHSMEEIYNKLYLETTYGDDDEFAQHKYKWSIVEKRLINIKTLLDVGCGKGYYLRKCIDLGIKCTGIEFSSVCCDHHLSKIKEAQIYKTNILDFKSDAIFDFILCMDFLEHIEPENINVVLEIISKYSPRAIFGIANHPDIQFETELHKIQQDAKWWEELLSKFYKTISKNFLSDRFFIFYVEK
jgi:2-polyprenyl-3-methyl-5-hydroxy-6-metoxy-1,4-benzoquinol methylase